MGDSQQILTDMEKIILPHFFLPPVVRLVITTPAVMEAMPVPDSQDKQETLWSFVETCGARSPVFPRSDLGQPGHCRRREDLYQGAIRRCQGGIILRRNQDPGHRG